MKRWHQDQKIAKREWRKHRQIHVDSNKDYPRGKIGQDPYQVDCACDDQIGRFRKKDAYDCGKVQCKLCHSDKFPKREKNEQEIMSELKFKEQLREM